MFTFIFGSVAGLFNKWDSACIDNYVFRLHYRITVIILLSAVGLVTSGQFFGDPIDCMSDSMSSGIMDMYCWIHSTYSINSKFNGSRGVDFPHPGLGEDDVHGNENSHTYHKYYQWVVFVLTLQAGMFYLPWLLWKNYEGGVMKLLTAGLNDIPTFMDKTTKDKKVKIIAEYYRRGAIMDRSDNRRLKYSLMFVFFEILNLVNVFGQIYFTDMFLGYQFTKFGRNVFSKSEEDLNLREDPMHKVFPKVAKCRFSKFGPSGGTQVHDALCVLPLNIINEKIYIFLYFWFVFLAAVSSVWLLYRLLTIFSLGLRVDVIHRRSDKMVPKDLIERALSSPKHSGMERLGDYLLLYLITKNVNTLIIKDVFEKIAPVKYLGWTKPENEDEAALLRQQSSAPEMPEHELDLQ